MATALITGGTSGIGAAFARALAARGDDLVLVARNADRLTEMATELKERYAVSAEVIVADLAIRSDVVSIAERLASIEQPIELLVNNAGFAVRKKLTDADTTPHERAIDVMIRAVLMLGAAPRRLPLPRRSTRHRWMPPIPTRRRRLDASAHRRGPRSRLVGPPRSPASTTPTSRTVTTPSRCWRTFAPAGCGQSSGATSRWWFISASTPTVR